MKNLAATVKDLAYMVATKGNVDKRSKAYKQATKLGLSESEMKEIATKHNSRKKPYDRVGTVIEQGKRFISAIKHIESIADVHDNTYSDTASAHRPANNGKGYAVICNGERSNNLYTENKNIIAVINKHFNK